jgi:energy-coupling factor transport system substrate-specific component
MDRKLWQFGRREVVLSAIGTALFGGLAWATNTMQIPAIENVSIRPAIAIPMFFGVAFGPIVGFIVGFLGNIIGDLLTGYNFWLWGHLGNGIQAMIPGLISPTIRNHRDGRTIIRALIMVFFGLIIGAGIVAIAEMWVTGADYSTAMAIHFLPTFITNAIGCLIMIPILMVAYALMLSRDEH